MTKQPPGGAWHSPLEGILGCLVALVVLCCLGPATGQCAQPGWRQLSGHVPGIVAQLAPLGRLPGSNQLSLAIGVPLRNQTALDDLLAQVYDPHSTNYHRYLTPAEFTERFGPTPGDYQAVEQFVTAHGLQVTRRHANRVVLDVQGSVAQIEAAFQTTLRTYQHPTEGRHFYAPDVEPSVPANVPVADMWGLSDYGLPQPQFHPAAAPATPENYNGTGNYGTYQGRDFRNAYAPGTSLVGSGQTAAVAEFDSYYASDITAYESKIGYTNIPLQKVIVDNVSGNPGYSGVSGANTEVSLDMEMIISMAPALSNLLVYEGSSPYDVFNRIVTDNLAKELSCSWAWNYGPGNTRWPGGTTRGTLDSQLAEMALQGQSFFEASGDVDAYTGTAALNGSTGPIPVDSPYVTSVGGTSLTMNGGGVGWSSETTWNWGDDNGSYVGSSGGVSVNYTNPPWQAGISMAINGGSTRYRNIPDVALTADAVEVYYGNGTNGIVGGTSCAAPLWAGFCALLNQQSLAVGGSSLGLLNAALYAVGTNVLYTNCFHDITTGNNIGSHTAGLYYATNGYDLCTGLGTPNGTNLINALAPPLQPFFIFQPAGQTLVSGSSFTLGAVAGGVAPYGYYWLCNGTNLAAGGNVSGVTSNVLSITSATTNNAGNYSLVVTNVNGSATSVVAVVNIGFAPALATQPAPLTVFAGSNAMFNVTATGSVPLTWQWRENNTNLANGTAYSGVNTSQLTVLAARTNSGGNFSVVINNLYGSATSSSAALNVVQPPVFTTPLTGQTIQCSSNATLSVTVIATPPPAYQWGLDGVAIAGATNTSLSLTNVHLPSHLVSVSVTNLYGSATNTATLTVQDTQPPVVTLTGTNPLYLELKSAFNDPGATAYDACSGAEAVTVLGTVNTNAVGTNVLVYQATDGSGNIGSASRTVIVHDTIPPVILGSFTNLVLAAGANCQAPMPDVTGTNFIQATDLAGTTLITERPAANSWLQLGTNQVILTVSDPYGNQAYSTNSIVVQDETPPVVTTQPQSLTNNAGTPAAFALTATACTPLSYQWYFNTTVLVGQTNATLTLASVALTNAGNYSAVATASGGSTTSAVAVLSVPTPPVIQWSFTNLVLLAVTNCAAPMSDVTGTNYILATVWSGLPVITQNPDTNADLPVGTNQVVLAVDDNLGNVVYSTNTIVVQDATAPVLLSQPQSATNTAGSPASFSVTASACTPLSYQWSFANALLAGQTNATLTLASVDLTAAGAYSVVVTSAGGAITSSVATLTVASLPVVQWSFTNLVLLAVANCAASMPDVTGTNYLLATVWSGLPVITQSPATNTDLPVGTNQVVLAVADDLGNVVYSTNTIVVQDVIAPVLATQPQSATNTVGTPATFAVTATACTPLNYQWLLNDQALVGQTNATLSLSSVAATNAGDYSVVVTSAGGSTTSGVAVLVVTVPLVLAVQNNPGAGFALTATGPVGGTCIVEMTTNLVSPDGWQALFTNDFDPTGTAQFLDSAATNDVQRFYRARLGP